MSDAKAHIEEAYRILTGEVFNGPGPDAMRPVDGVCTLVWDLERIDAAIGERGKSVFAALAQTVQQAYIEICAARQAVQTSHDKVAALADALEKIAADNYGLQGLIEDGASDAQIAEYWHSEVTRRRNLAREALSKTRAV